MMFKFLNGMDRDIQQTLLHQIRDLWTHTSTALEGNTLTLGDTKFVLDEGLTVTGKPIKDHQEVVGHAKAIELIYGMIGQEVTETHLFELHKAVQSEEVSDIYKPYGAWKVEPNGTYMVNEQGRQIFLEYDLPAAVPALMREVIEYIDVIASYQKTIGALTISSSVWPDESRMNGFVHFCERAYGSTQDLIKCAQQQQSKRGGMVE